MISKKIFFKLIHNVVFGKTVENMKKLIDMKLVTTEVINSCLVLEPNQHTTKGFIENLLVIEMRKTQIFMNKLLTKFKA